MADLVKSVELIEYTMSASTTLASVTLTKGQNVTNCVPIFSSRGDGNYYDCHFYDVWFNSATTISFQRAAHRSLAGYICCYVVEFDPAEVRVQQGSFSVAAAATTTTITTPTTFASNRTAMFFANSASSTSQFMGNSSLRGKVISDGSLEFYRNGTEGIVAGHYFIFESLNSKFYVNHGTMDSASSTNCTIASPQQDLCNTFVIGSFTTSSNYSAPAYSTCRILLPASPTLRLDTQTTAGTMYLAYQLITFTDDKCHVFSNKNGSFVAATQSWDFSTLGHTPYDSNLRWNTSTTTVVPSIMAAINRTSTTSTSYINELFTTYKVINDYTAGAQKFGGSSATFFSFCVVDWLGISVTTGMSSSPLDPTKTFVKSVENGRVTIEDFTINIKLNKGQTVANCVVFASFKGIGPTAFDSPCNIVCSSYFSNNTLCITRGGDGDQAVVDYSVVEFYPEQIKVQSGYTYFAGAASTTILTKAITAVSSINKAFLLFSNTGDWTQTYYTYSITRGRLIDTSTIDFYRSTTGSYININWFIIEDLVGNNFYCEHFSTTTTNNYYSLNTTTKFDYRTTFVIGSSMSATDSASPSYLSYRIYYDWEYGPFYMYTYSAPGWTYYHACTAVKIIRDPTRRFVQVLYGDFNASTTTTTMNYNSESANHVNLTLFNMSVHSTAACSTTSTAYVDSSFFTAMITDYTNKSIEISSKEAGASRNCSFNLVDWEGDSTVVSDYSTYTKSLIKSIQTGTTANPTGRFWNIPITKKQNIAQCLPIITWSTYYTDGDFRRAFPIIWSENNRFELRTRYSSSETYINYNILEFDSTQVKIQHNVVMLDGTSITVTFDAVDLNKAFVYFTIEADVTTSYWAGTHVNHLWVSNTQITFSVGADYGRVLISYYIVECLQNQWLVQHKSDYINSSITSYNMAPSTTFTLNKTLAFVSISSAATNGAGAYGAYKAAINQDTYINISSYAVSGNTLRVSADVVEFSPDMDVRTFESWATIVTSATAVTKSLFLTNRELDLKRSIIFNQLMSNTSLYSSTTAPYNNQSFCRYSLVDNNTIRVSRPSTVSTAVNSDSVILTLELPPFNTHYVEGNVMQSEDYVQRKVRLYRADTGKIMDEATSDVDTGYFKLYTSYSGIHYAVCLDSSDLPDYNDLIYGSIVPTVISGSFAYNEGWVS